MGAAGVDCDGQVVTTIEGLGAPKTGKFDPLQQAFIDHTAFQCAFCAHGILMSRLFLFGRGTGCDKNRALNI
jgi:aerobic-type carbon monoxide dehydrogenase small subunit (CoxS/CutS family)